MNVELLQKVKERILRRPAALDMNNWECGTAACIAGHAMRIARRKFRFPMDQFTEQASGVLSLRGIDGARLFVLCNWPHELSERYRRACSWAAAARVTAERIDLFISSGGKE